MVGIINTIFNKLLLLPMMNLQIMQLVLLNFTKKLQIRLQKLETM